MSEMQADSFDLDRWIEQIAKTREREISCSECFDLIAEYVDAELAAQEPTPRMGRVAQHLGQCRVCREEYEVLHDLAALDNRGERSSPNGSGG